MKKKYVKPETVYVDLITEGSFCCSRCGSSIPTNECDCEDDTEEEGGGVGGGGTIIPATANEYRRPIWED